MRSSSIRALSLAFVLGMGASFGAQAGTTTFTTGVVKEEFYAGGSDLNATLKSTANPTWIKYLRIFDTPEEQGSNYSDRLTTYITPTDTDDYRIFVSGDDQCDVYVSTDDTPGNIVKVASEPAWNNPDQWVNTARRNADKPENRTDLNGYLAKTAWNGKLHLVANKKYYMVVVHREGGGGDNVGCIIEKMSDPDPADGDPATSGSLIGMFVPNGATFLSQPVSTKVLGGTPFSFAVAVDADGPTYQWFKNNSPIQDATNSVYGQAGAKVADDGAVFICKVTVGGTVYPSDPATLNVITPLLASGYLRWDFFSGEQNLDNTMVRTDPTFTKFIQKAETPTGQADNYTERLSGFFLPLVTADYVFMMSTDDNGRTYLSSDEDPANLVRIAFEPNWNGARAWTATSRRNGDAPENRSDTAGLIPTGAPWNGKIHLIKGNKYAFVAVHQEGGGGDDLGVLATTVANVDNVADGDPPIGADADGPARIATLVDPNTPVNITQDPADASVLEGQTAKFTVAANSPYSLNYQWQKNGSNIPGANNASYTTPVLALSDNGETFSVIVSLPGINKPSKVAHLTVSKDTLPPVASVGTLSHDGKVELGVSFNKAVTAASASKQSNYALTGGTITGLRVNTNDNQVVLSTSGLSVGGSGVLTITGVTDVIEGNVMPATPVSFTVGNKSWIGVGGTELGFKPDAVAIGANGYDVVSGGVQFWSEYDETTFVFESVHGNFDKVVRVESVDFASNWARSGIMIRETLDEGKVRPTDTTDPAQAFSRYQDVHTNPLAGQDFNGGGNNAYEANQRIYTGGIGKIDGNITSGIGLDHNRAPNYPQAWVRMARAGDSIHMYLSNDGMNWQFGNTQVFPTVDVDGNDYPPFPKNAFVGLNYGPENGNVTDPPANPTDYQRSAWLTKFRDYSDMNPAGADAPTVTGAEAPTGAPTSVFVYFSKPINATTGGNKANYTVSGTTVNAATVWDDNETVQLTVAQALSTSGTYTVTVNNVTDQNTPGIPVAAGSHANVLVRVIAPDDYGTTVNGYQDDFDGATRNPDWAPTGPGGDVYTQNPAGLGTLMVAPGSGDPNHLTYAPASGYNDKVQEVLIRIRATTFDSGDANRGGVAAVLQGGSGINLHYRDSDQSYNGGTTIIPGRQFKLLDDGRSWGPASMKANFTENTWYWMRLSVDMVNTGNVNIWGKVWPGDGNSPEPQGWTHQWQRDSRNGLAGIAASVGGAADNFEVDYFLLKAAGLPSIGVTSKFAPRQIVVNVPLKFTSITLNGTSVQFAWTGTGTLQSSADLATWGDVAGATSPRTVTVGTGNKFYRLKQ